MKLSHVRSTLVRWALAVTCLVAYTPPAAAQTFPSSLPQMTGSAEAPKTVPPAQHLDYVLTQTDQDRSFLNELFTDLTCVVEAVMIESMVVGSWTVTLRGVGANGTHTWDVGGTAVNQIGEWRDRWRLKNNRPQGDIYLDDPIVVTQVVHVNIQAGGGSGGGN